MANPTGANQVLTKIYQPGNNTIRVEDMSGGSGGGSSPPTTPTLVNFAVPVADVEENYTLPSDTKKFWLKSRKKATVKLAYLAGQSSVEYLTIYPGTVYYENGILSSAILYFQSNITDDIIEILSWA